jgi:hypothetical protein
MLMPLQLSNMRLFATSTCRANMCTTTAPPPRPDQVPVVASYLFLNPQNFWLAALASLRSGATDPSIVTRMHVLMSTACSPRPWLAGEL